jgi:hypothetical protein
MGSRMEPVRIDIPAARPLPIDRQAGQIVLDALAEAGLHPLRAAGNPMVRALLGSWGRGESTRAEFVNGCRNMGILNPKLKLEDGDAKA